MEGSAISGLALRGGGRRPGKYLCITQKRRRLEGGERRMGIEKGKGERKGMVKGMEREEWYREGRGNEGREREGKEEDWEGK